MSSTCCALTESARLYEDLAFWAPHQSSVEVDFLLRRGRDYLALEAKASDRPSNSQLRGLPAIADLPRVVRRVLVYAGRRKLKTPEGIEVWPVGELSEALIEDRLWP